MPFDEMEISIALWAESRGLLVRPGERSALGGRVISVERAGHQTIDIALTESPIDERIGVHVLPLGTRRRDRWRSQIVKRTQLTSALDRALRRAGRQG